MALSGGALRAGPLRSVVGIVASGYRMKYASGHVGRKAAPPVVQGVTTSGA
jgi:hypothetical protein